MSQSEHLFPYEWYLKNGYPAKGIEPNNKKVFGTFVCGGGSTMGYKLAGFTHLGGVELDKAIANIYQLNHHPKYLFVEDIRDFNERIDLPAELYQLDLLDGSPPCSTFSMAGVRERAWGKDKKFTEGQKKQRLDDLVFVYCETIKKLQPKCFLLENVSGLVLGNARAYTRQILRIIDEAGYTAQVFLLNSATMGVPQQRQRVFIIGHKKEYQLPKLVLDFKEPPILFGEIKDAKGRPITAPWAERAWKSRKPQDNSMGDTNLRIVGKNTGFTNTYAKDNRVLGTVTAGSDIFLYSAPLFISKTEIIKASSFPLDYDTQDRGVQFICGMSVPPIMTAQVAHQIYLQWLSKL